MTAIMPLPHRQHCRRRPYPGPSQFQGCKSSADVGQAARPAARRCCRTPRPWQRRPDRSEEHTSELQSLTNLVCRLLLEKKRILKDRSVVEELVQFFIVSD